MKILSAQEIRDQAHAWHTEGQVWHFHIMSPTCVFNDQQKYAFVLECSSQQFTAVYYSDHAEKQLGSELAPLLHGANVLDETITSTDYQPSKNIERIIQRAAELNQQRVEWHHHVLFPGCILNKHPSKFSFVFEDPETNEILENLTDEEPSSDIKLIEPLFFKNLK